MVHSYSGLGVVRFDGEESSFGLSLGNICDSLELVSMKEGFLRRHCIAYGVLAGLLVKETDQHLATVL